MKTSVLIFCCAVFFSCTQNAGRQADETGDTTNIANEVIIEPMDTSAYMLLTPEEIADDSIFADGTVPTSWQNAGFDDPERFKYFLKELQRLVMNNDKRRIATVIRYPLNEQIKNEADFIDHYDEVFTRDVKMSFATVRFNQIFRNQNGAMTEGGKVWFAPQGKEFKIIAINQ